MTGQIAFARTIRALDSDDFRGSKMGLFFAIVLLACWAWWFITSSVPQFSEIGKSCPLEWAASHRVSVSILGNPLICIPGLAAQIRFDGRTIGARVAAGSCLQPSPVQALLLDVSSTIQPPFPSRATIDIETARVSPAAIVLRALHR